MTAPVGALAGFWTRLSPRERNLLALLVMVFFAMASVGLPGLNGFVGVCADNHVRIGDVTLTVATPLRGDVLVTIHPRAVALFRERPSGSPRNVWTARAVDFEALLDRDRVRVRLDGALSLVAEITPAAVADLRLRDGGEVWVAVKATEIGVTPR